MSKDQPTYGNGETDARAREMAELQREHAVERFDEPMMGLLYVGDALMACEAQLRRLADGASWAMCDELCGEIEAHLATREVRRDG